MDRTTRSELQYQAGEKDKANCLKCRNERLEIAARFMAARIDPKTFVPALPIMKDLANWSLRMADALLEAEKNIFPEMPFADKKEQ